MFLSKRKAFTKDRTHHYRKLTGSVPLILRLAIILVGVFLINVGHLRTPYVSTSVSPCRRMTGNVSDITLYYFKLKVVHYLIHHLPFEVQTVSFSANLIP